MVQMDMVLRVKRLPRLAAAFAASTSPQGATSPARPVGPRMTGVDSRSPSSVVDWSLALTSTSVRARKR